MSKTKKWLFIFEVFTKVFWALADCFKKKKNEEEEKPKTEDCKEDAPVSD